MSVIIIIMQRQVKKYYAIVQVVDMNLFRAV